MRNLSISCCLLIAVALFLAPREAKAQALAAGLDPGPLGQHAGHAVGGGLSFGTLAANPVGGGVDNLIFRGAEVGYVFERAGLSVGTSRISEELRFFP